MNVDLGRGRIYLLSRHHMECFAHMITGCLLEWGPGLSKHKHTHNPMCPNTQIFTESFESGDLQMCADTHVMDLNSNSYSETSRPLGQQKFQSQ